MSLQIYLRRRLYAQVLLAVSALAFLIGGLVLLASVSNGYIGAYGVSATGGASPSLGSASTTATVGGTPPTGSPPPPTSNPPATSTVAPTSGPPRDPVAVQHDYSPIITSISGLITSIAG